ncbi:MAG: carbamoyl-phosphate synthase (glutamine-hydrolyzing) large subunit [Promethearchaeota archaeon]
MEKMPNNVLILGSGGLSIGQAGEFDYSGSQAIKALKEAGIRTILANPNIATIQTSANLADRLYFLPITPDFVEEIIIKEQPDGILLSFGGQTALNCGVALYEKGILAKYNVQVLGTPIEAIIATEDRKIFKEKLEEIGVKVPHSIAVTSLEEAFTAIEEIGFPVIIRAAYALGGLGSGFCNNLKELKERVMKAFSSSNQVLVEESLKGWKEVEYEVVRDSYGNCITVCNMENLDPLGIHTGESIVVAPSQTLNNREYHELRKIALQVIKHLGIVGECNIQYALDPESEDYRVIEVNARLSRSSALASKATGYPLAFVAAKLALGLSLNDIMNPVTKTTTAFFEPALDYVTVKIPRWDTEKFRNASKELGSGMKSVGEVMAIGRKFEEALQKAIRMSRDSYLGLIEDEIEFKDIDYELGHPSHERIFAVAQGLRRGRSIDEIHSLTAIDKWFLYKINNIIDLDKEIAQYSLDSIPIDFFRTLKQYGFSDKQIAKRIFKQASFHHELLVREKREALNIRPVIKQIDTLAAEFPAQTNYLYLTYNGQEDDITITDQALIVLGSGAYSIGSSVEFDWCCVACVKTLRQRGYPTVVINYNPETVSTDYDESDRLYFEELTYERVLDICQKENPKGVIISFGGQIPNKLAVPLNQANIPIMGTAVENIDRAENRQLFSKLLDELGVDQPAWKQLSSLEEIKSFASQVGYPVLLRPSYVLSGAAMRVAYNDKDLVEKLKEATKISPEYPVVISRFIINAKEIEMDAVAKNGELIVYAISEHIENAGVHSGDATLVTPAQKLFLETMRRIKKISRQLIKALNVTGPINIQFLAKDNKIKVIECNLRASRTFPFVSKVYKINFIELATCAILGENVEKVSTQAFDLDYLGIKAPQFSFTRLRGADPILGVEMTSTGEVASFGEEIHEAFLKAWLSTGTSLPQKKTVLLSTGDIEQKARFLPSVRKLKEKGYTLFATEGTSKFYEMNDIKMHVLHWPLDYSLKPNVLDFLKTKEIELVINIPKSNEREELDNDYIIRRISADYSIPLITNLQVAMLFVDSLSLLKEGDLKIKAWDEY